MKNYLVICALILLSSCIKVENANLCPNAPPAPTLPQSTYDVPQGGVLNAGVVSPDGSLVYYWLSPEGYTYKGSSINVGISYYDFGQWSLVSQKGLGCVSDTTKFNVELGVGNCGVGRDSLVIDASLYKIVSEQSSYTSSYYGTTYSMTFTCSNGSSIVVSLPSRPQTSSTYNVIDPSSNYYLNGNQCSIEVTSGYYYSSASGTVSVVNTGSALNIEFCSVQFENNGTYSTTYGSGYLVGN